MRGQWRAWLGFAILAVLIGLAPVALSDYGVVLGFGFFVSAGLAVAWNLIGGFAGQFALGHSAFVGIGAYTVAVLCTWAQTPPWIALLVGGAVCVVLAALTALLFLRMRGAYFSVGTMGFALACTAAVVVSPMLGGTGGITLPATIATDDLTLYRVAGGLALALVIASWAISRSPFGLAIMAMRDDETAAVESGVNALVVKCLIMALSGGVVGIIGGVVALQKLTIEPYSAFSLNWTIAMIMMSVVGGLGTVWGPVIGALVIYTSQQMLDQLAVLNLLLTAILLIAVIRLAPGGIVGLVEPALFRFRRRSGGSA